MNVTGNIVVLATLWGAWAAAAPAADPASATQPATRPGSSPATRPAADKNADRAARLAGFIQAVESAEDPSSAAAAYARGNVLDPSSIKLHETYMVRMLKFGLPKIAVFPARTLVRLDREHGLAWAVIGYVEGQRGDLIKAFDATITAAWLRRDNPAVLNNAGQLVAWYDSEKDPPDVTAAARRWLEQMRPELAKKKEFADAYDLIAKGYAQRAALSAEVDRKVPAAEAAVNTLRQQLAEADAEYRSISSQIDSHNRILDSLKRELFYYLWYDYNYDRDNYYYYNRYRHAELRDRIRQEELVIEQLRQQGDRIRAAAQAIQSELRIQEKNLAALHGEQERAMNRVFKRFRWDPPAVDGAITPEVESFTYPPPKRTPASKDPEVLASQRLNVARLYVRHNLPEKALEILTEIITNYGQTQAADEAKSLLEVMKQDR